METNNYSRYPEIEQHIRAARISRVVALADTISGFVADCWNAFQAPPAPPALLPIDRRRESRDGVTRSSNRFVHR